MKTRAIIKITSIAIPAVLGLFFIGVLGTTANGRDLIAGVSLPLIFLLIVVKIMATIIDRRNSGFGGDGGSPLAGAMVVAPVRPGPPMLSGAAQRVMCRTSDEDAS